VRHLSAPLWSGHATACDRIKHHATGIIDTTIERSCSVIGITVDVNRTRDSVNITITSTTCMSAHPMPPMRSVTGISHGVVHNRNTHNNIRFLHIHSSQHDIDMMLSTIAMPELTTKISHRGTRFIDPLIHVGRPAIPRGTLNIQSGTMHTLIRRVAILISHAKRLR